MKGKVWVLQRNNDSAGHSLSVGIDNIGHPNGMFWRKNGTEVLFSRTFINVVEKYEYSKSAGAVLGEPSEFVQMREGEGLLDSMCGFRDGSFLVADPAHKLLRHYDANGHHKCNIDVPIEGSTFVASCAFVGDDLYITTGRNGGDTSGKAGKLYRIRGVTGGAEAQTCNVQAPQLSMVIV